ncbi:MAG: DNA-processing protein DprA [Erysipelotrichia bacterium]|nr:DNA-processing protein DprA [Erysipelotrichia bacterium]
MRNYLIQLAIKYRGDYFQIKKAIERKEVIRENIALQEAITILDDDYPPELLELKEPPFVLFYCGNKQLLQGDKISVVGSREITDYGKRMTEHVVGMLSKYTIISGLAKGIDSIAHYNAKKTIAVIGNGLNVYYPYENRQLYEMLFEKQLVLSEYPLDVTPLKRHFPFRNRIIAALGQAVIVTQAKEKSGTMLTVNEAINLNREVYCIPYSYDDESGIGCNLLIQQGANMIIQNNLNDIFDKNA